MPRSTSDERYIHVTLQEPGTGTYLSERAFLHGIITSLLLAHNSLLWYFPSGKCGPSALHPLDRSLTAISTIVLRTCGLLNSFEATEEWNHVIADYTLLAHLGMAYIIFSHIDGTLCRWSPTSECILQTVVVVFILEGAFTVSWGCEFCCCLGERKVLKLIPKLGTPDLLYQNFGLMMEFASYDGSWKSLGPIVVQNLVFISWAGTVMHTLLPAIDGASRAVGWGESLEVFAMDVQDYPWVGGRIALDDENTSDVESVIDRKAASNLV